MNYKLDLINIIDDFKHKLTDIEYKNAVETLQKINLEKQDNTDVARVFINRAEHNNEINTNTNNRDQIFSDLHILSRVIYIVCFALYFTYCLVFDYISGNLDISSFIKGFLFPFVFCPALFIAFHYIFLRE